MKVQVIGAGVVGKAFGTALERLNHEVVYKDIDYGEIDYSCDFFFICTPEGAVESVLEEIGATFKPVVIKSTITPAMYNRFKEKFRWMHITINPEFLREKEALWMSLNPHYIIIGECCEEHGSQLEKLYTPYRCPIARVTPKTAILAKLFSNAYLSTAISFWNEMWLISKKEKDVSTYEIGRTVSLEPRIPTHGATMHGMPYSGKCLPKDMNHLIEYAESLGVDPVLLKAVREVNEKVKRKLKNSNV